MMPIIAAAQSVEPIRYNLSFPAPHTHYVEVSATVPTAGQSEIQLMLAVWTPGSYLVREFARHIENVTAHTDKGQTLEIHKVSKNRWRVSTGKTSHVVVKYRVYGREMSVRTNWIETSFALLNGAPTFMTLADGKPRPHEVAIELANGWTQAMTGLEEIPGIAHQFHAQDFDTLVDSPILLGNPTVHSFIVDGKPHYLVNEGEVDLFDGAKAAKGLVIIGSVVVSAAFGWLSIASAAATGALLIVLSRCISMEEAYAAIEWNVLFLLAGMLALSVAMEKTGTSTMLAEGIIDVFGTMGPTALVAAFFGVTMVLTAVMSNQATVALLIPVAITTAYSLDANPRTFMFAVMFAASSSFMTPVGYQTNTMIYGPGQYRFADFIRVGTPLTLIFWVLGTLLIPWFWPL